MDVSLTNGMPQCSIAPSRTPLQLRSAGPSEVEYCRWESAEFSRQVTSLAESRLVTIGRRSCVPGDNHLGHPRFSSRTFRCSSWRADAKSGTWLHTASRRIGTLPPKPLAVQRPGTSARLAPDTLTRLLR